MDWPLHSRDLNIIEAVRVIILTENVTKGSRDVSVNHCTQKNVKNCLSRTVFVLL